MLELCFFDDYDVINQQHKVADISSIADCWYILHKCIFYEKIKRVHSLYDSCLSLNLQEIRNDIDFDIYDVTITPWVTRALPNFWKWFLISSFVYKFPFYIFRVQRKPLSRDENNNLLPKLLSETILLFLCNDRPLREIYLQCLYSLFRCAILIKTFFVQNLLCAFDDSMGVWQCRAPPD